MENDGHTPNPGENTDQPPSLALLCGNTGEGLERLRKRLLDLTQRNRLLNFRHTTRSSLRIVDEVPNYLYQGLVDGQTFTFVPVSEPTRHELIDYYQRQGTIWRNQRPSVEEWAKYKGIWMDFELLLNPHENEPQHTDAKIQTLLYPDDLEASLLKIASAARTATEESGTNMLYLALGFLEWRESDQTQSKSLAPLVLLPVSIERGSVSRTTGTYSYKIAYSGEDVTTNLSLQEKLKQDFGLMLPDLEDEELPETYFHRVEEEVAGKSEWRVRRFVTLSLFHFGKLLMYLDLDPLKWPGQNILNHQIVRTFFEGADTDNQISTEEYRLDDHPELTARTPLIFDADSSQHSALIDTIQGRNLVIEGPPGTGKSQTITNLIAAAFDQGKTVLFVSEKLAALEVVRRRLGEAGLGDFCLELHSHKTQKKALISEIKTRLEKRDFYSSPREIESKIEALERDKAHLKRHSELMAREFGKIGKTTQEILCAAARYRLNVGPCYTLLSDFQIRNLIAIRPAEMAEIEGVLVAYQAAYKDILRQWQTSSAHPWSGVRNIELQPFDTARVEQLLRAWKEEGNRLKRELTTLQEMTRFEVGIADHMPLSFAEMAQSIPSPAGDEWLHILPQLSTPENTVRLKHFENQLKQFHEVAGRLEQVLEDHRIVKDTLKAALVDAIAQILKIANARASVLLLEEHRAQLDHLKSLVQTISPVLDDLTRHLGTPIPLNKEGIIQVRMVIEVCQQAPYHLLHLRDNLFENVEIDDVLASVEVEILSLEKQKKPLQDAYNLNLVPASQMLRQAQQTMASGGVLRWLKRDWREANRLLRGMSIGKVKGAPAVKARLLSTLAQYKEHLEEFEHNERTRRVLKHLYNGVNTDVPGLSALRKWYVTVRQDLRYSLGSRGIAPEAVLNLDGSVVQAIAQLGEDEFKEHLSQIEYLLNLLKKAISVLSNSRLDGSQSILPDIAVCLDNALSIFTRARINKSQSLGEIARIPDQLQQLDELKHSIESESFAQATLGDSFDGTSTDQEKIAGTLALARRIHKCKVPQEFKFYLFSQGTASSFQSLKDSLSTTAAVFSQMEQRKSEFAEYTQLDFDKWFSAHPDTTDLDGIIARADRALSGLDSLAQWVTYMRARNKLREEQLLDFASAAEGGNLSIDQLVPAYRCLFYDNLARAVLNRYPALCDFSGYDQNTIRERFKRCDEDIILLQQQKIASKIDDRPVFGGVDRGTANSRTELRLLEHEANKQRRHIPIRHLMQRAGKALQGLKPCFMMGPLSVAQYLQPGLLNFDLVVMDEASQIRPEDALGAIARGSQIVVVGDPKQLPPTRFFDRMFGEEDEEEDATVLEDAESILDATLTVFPTPKRRLLWHYRSRHEKLIAFSNHYFYSDNPMIVFPSPYPDDPRYGIRLVAIRSGVFNNHRNIQEAQAISKAVIQHMRTNREESLGVVAMNNHQSDLIADEVERLLKQDPQAQGYLDSYSNHPEPFFVKNLENVQGDERDVVFISFTYGPSAPGGQVYQRFGPINSNVGWRRLNVLFTRAKNRIVAFSSMSSSDIRGGADVSEGVRALKNYLAYAETGILEQAREGGRPPDSDFEVAVADALRRAGYECEAQVGVAGFFIDIAVRHPELPGKYLLGVECDGATYHSARSVRDRDRLRQAALENLGWKIYRIWSVDWFRDPQSEIRRVLERLSELRAEEPPVHVLPLGSGENLPIREAIGVYTPGSDRFLTEERAREMLIELRENRIKVEMPDSDPTEGFLRRTMLDALLKYRPNSKDDFRRKIPIHLREKLDTNQFARYHEEVFSILAQIADPHMQSLF